MALTYRKRGRPALGDGPKLPKDEVDRLLVEGELLDGAMERSWPSQREVARRFHVAPSLVAAFAKAHRVPERRAEFQAALASVVAASASPPAPPASSESQRRRPGRPRKADAPLIPYEELDRLLVFGEAIVTESGATTTVYPTHRRLADRYGVASSVIAEYSRAHNCMKRRQQASARVAARTEEKLIDLRADVISVGEDRLIQMIDNFLVSFEKALEEGRVRADNPTDVNTLARLKSFLLGGADSRQDVRASLSLESLQTRHARALRELELATPEMSGVVEARAAERGGEHPKPISSPRDRFRDRKALISPPADVEARGSTSLDAPAFEFGDGHEDVGGDRAPDEEP